MHPLVENAHMFELAQIIAEHDSRLQSPAAIFDASNVETPESTTARFRTYNEYERYNVALSRLVVEALISPSFRETIKTRFSHYDTFDDLPG